MSKGYQPPFTMTEKITGQIIEIGKMVGKISSFEALSTNPKLRRANRIKTIHSSLAIENNTLTLEQATAVIDGKKILAPLQDIKEVKNAYLAYEHLLEYDPYSIKDLLLAHRFMMSDLVNESGMFRSKNIGVYSEDVLVHAGTPAKYVPELMGQLFDWLKNSKLHPLVKSCIFHYEFEFLHPFNDGNGRTGRLWQTLILQKWEPIFAWLPIETIIRENQQGYYESISKSNEKADSNTFVEFMLEVIEKTLVGINVGINVGIKPADKILVLLKEEPTITENELSQRLNISKRQVERIISELKNNNKIERVGTNKKGQWKVL